MQPTAVPAALTELWKGSVFTLQHTLALEIIVARLPCESLNSQLLLPTTQTRSDSKRERRERRERERERQRVLTLGIGLRLKLPRPSSQLTSEFNLIQLSVVLPCLKFRLVSEDVWTQRRSDNASDSLTLAGPLYSEEVTI